MATTTLNTRIQLKYDTYENWTANNPVLLAGEVAVVVVPASSGAVPNEPTVLFKVGDGTAKFNALQWVAAPAADVYSWAKQSTKPTYKASEIEGLEDYISGQIEDTDTQYQIIASGTNGIQLQSRPKTGGAWTNVGSPITITYTLAEGSANGTVAFNGVDVPVHGLGTAAYEASTAFDVAGAAAGVQTTVTGTSSDASTAITIYGTRKYAAEQATAAQTAATSAAKSYTDGQITQAKTDLIGTGDATSTTIKGAVVESKTYTDTQIAANGAGVPSTEGVPTDYLLSPAGWVAPPSGGGGNDSPYELITTIEITEDGIGEIERDLGAKYQALLITNKDIFSLTQVSNTSPAVTSSGGVRIDLKSKEEAGLSGRYFIPYNSNQPTTTAKRLYYFSITKLQNLWFGSFHLEFQSGGWQLSSGVALSAGFLQECYYSSEYFDYIKLKGSFVNPLTLYVYGVPYQGGAA